MEPNKYRAYACNFCGHLHSINTNHKLDIYSVCPNCRWRRPSAYHSHSSTYIAEDIKEIKKTGIAEFEGKKTASRLFHLIDAGRDDYHHHIVRSASIMIASDSNKGYYMYHTQYSSGKCLWLCADEDKEILI
jgi:DNA-directed RNA polymerase subunit RPC12/RpoP